MIKSGELFKIVSSRTTCFKLTYLMTSPRITSMAVAFPRPQIVLNDEGEPWLVIKSDLPIGPAHAQSWSMYTPDGMLQEFGLWWDSRQVQNDFGSTVHSNGIVVIGMILPLESFKLGTVKGAMNSTCLDTISLLGTI